MGEVMTVEKAPLKRLMRLCRAVCAGDGATLQELQGKLKVSRRTIFRDLNLLEDMGITVALDAKGYKIRKSVAACRKTLAERQLTTLSRLLNVWLK